MATQSIGSMMTVEEIELIKWPFKVGTLVIVTSCNCNFYVCVCVTSLFVLLFKYSIELYAHVLLMSLNVYFCSLLK